MHLTNNLKYTRALRENDVKLLIPVKSIEQLCAARDIDVRIEHNRGGSK